VRSEAVTEVRSRHWSGLFGQNAHRDHSRCRSDTRSHSFAGNVRDAANSIARNVPNLRPKALRSVGDRGCLSRGL